MSQEAKEKPHKIGKRYTYTFFTEQRQNANGVSDCNTNQVSETNFLLNHQQIKLVDCQIRASLLEIQAWLLILTA